MMKIWNNIKQFDSITIIPSLSIFFYFSLTFLLNSYFSRKIFNTMLACNVARETIEQDKRN